MRAVVGVALGCVVLAGATACGEKHTPLELANEAAQKKGDQIEKRLEKAGYTVGGLAQAENLTPPPERAYTVRVDYTSPRSFTLTALVYRTPRLAQRFERSYERQCRSIPQCKALLAGGARLGRVVGPVVYSALVDNGTKPLGKERFDRIVSIAEGTADGSD
jgi:hypothetical protein